MKIPVTLTINGCQAMFEVEPDERLVETLRERAFLTGTKQGCGIGECGACSVLLDGRLVPSCLVLTASADGCSVVTVEGLSRDGRLGELQQAFVEEGAVQCGYCTPGMLMAATALLEKLKRPTLQQVRQGLAGNLCRCTGYKKIAAAVRKVSRRRAARG